ncbi:MAG: lecithin retinol acyltransferase family protein [Clostridia bacterium]|nr:lecithin retinol acyltransferase family protein [Clostridia bacterium]
MKWVLKEIKPADMVRVPSGSFYHYGICVDEDSIVQFGESVVNPLVDPNTVEVNKTDINDFLRGRFAEVAEYDKKELKRKNPDEKIIEYANKSIGKKGYHILYNNCEHFANECVFNVHSCSQTDDFRESLSKKFPMVDVYIASVDRFKSNKILPKYAKTELKAVKNESLAEQKRAVYGLLQYAVKNSFGKDVNIKSMSKDERGKPHMQDYSFSVSHTRELVCVAVSKSNIGADLEEIKEHSATSPLKTHILSESEKDKEYTKEELLELWTKKESIYKFDDGIKSYIPKEIDTNLYQTKSVKIDFEKKQYSLSVTAVSVMNVNILTLDGRKAT